MKKHKIMLNIAISIIMLNIFLLVYDTFVNTNFLQYIYYKENTLIHTNIERTLKIISILMIINSLGLFLIIYIHIRDRIIKIINKIF